MADKYGNYIAAFLMAGGVGVFASLIPFIILCVKRVSKEDEEENLDVDIEEEAVPRLESSV